MMPDPNQIPSSNPNPHLCQVLNGIAAIVAIQGAGLAVSQAIWSALGVLVAFAWGSLVFAEPVGSLPLALTGLGADEDVCLRLCARS